MTGGVAGMGAWWEAHGTGSETLGFGRPVPLVSVLSTNGDVASGVVILTRLLPVKSPTHEDCALCTDSASRSLLQTL